MNDQPETSIRPASQSKFRSRTERIANGKSLRDKLPRSTHATWQPPANRRDPIDILEESNQGRSNRARLQGFGGSSQDGTSRGTGRRGFVRLKLQKRKAITFTSRAE